MRAFVSILLLMFLSFSALMAEEIEKVVVVNSDTTYLYNKKGQKALMKVRGFDANGREVLNASYDLVDGKVIGNFMKLLVTDEPDKEVSIAYFWALNSWIPCDMQIDEFNEQHQIETSTSFHWVLKGKLHKEIPDGAWHSRFKVEYNYNDKGEGLTRDVYIWKKNDWVFSKKLAAN